MAMLNHILLVSRYLEIFYDKGHHYVTYHYYLYITGVGVAYMVLNGLVCIYFNVIITMSLITTIFTLQVWAWPTWCSMGWCVSTTTSSSLGHLSLLSLHYRCGRGLHGAQWAGVYLLQRHHRYVTYHYYLYITGVGVAYMVLNGLVCIYYNVIIAMSLYYLFASFTSDLPWGSCGHEWNTPACGDPQRPGNASKKLLANIWYKLKCFSFHLAVVFWPIHWSQVLSLEWRSM